MRRKMIDWLFDWVPSIMLLVSVALLTAAVPMMATDRARIATTFISLDCLFVALILQSTFAMMIVTVIGMCIVTVASTLNYS